MRRIDPSPSESGKLGAELEPSVDKPMNTGEPSDWVHCTVAAIAGQWSPDRRHFRVLSCDT